MARKSLSDAADSKLTQRQEGRGETPPPLVTPRRTSRRPKSFRLGVNDIDRLRRLSQKLGEEAGRHINDTDTLKGLLLLGEKTDVRELLTAIKDAVFESQ
jgi:hypothetical protein